MRTELHFHLLPAVDDGPEDDAEAVELARLAVADGTGRVIVTPHAHCVDFAELRPRTAELGARLAQAGVQLELGVGAELSPDHVPGLSQAALKSVAQGPSGRRWLLLEAPLFANVGSLAGAAAELRERGFGILVGHPERSPTTSMLEIREQVQWGAVLQVNASSLTRSHGDEVRRTGLRIARSGLPFVVASDAHSPDRPPLLTKAAAELAASGIADAVIREAIDDAPERLLVEGLPAVAAARRAARR